MLRKNFPKVQQNEDIYNPKEQFEPGKGVNELGQAEKSEQTKEQDADLANHIDAIPQGEG